MLRNVGAGMVVAAASLFLSGCDEKLSSVTGPTPGLTATFASIQAEIVESTDSAGRAACVNCHAPGRPAEGVMNLSSATAYAALVGVPSIQKPGAIRVIPGDPDNSYLVQKLEGRADIVGQRMPRTAGPFLTEGQMLVIRKWIQDGAANN